MADVSVVFARQSPPLSRDVERLAALVPEILSNPDASII
jgi:hypothetical protein